MEEAQEVRQVKKPRKSAASVGARELARKKAAEEIQRHERLLDLAASFFDAEAVGAKIREKAQDDEAKILERAQREIQRVHERAEKAAVQSDREAAKIVAEMVETGESKAAVAKRLGISAAELKQLLDRLEENQAEVEDVQPAPSEEGHDAEGEAA